MLSPFIETIQWLSVIFKKLWAYKQHKKEGNMCLVDYFFVVTVLLICDSHDNIGGNADKSNL